MHPIRDFQPTIRFSDIKLWFSSRQQNLIQGIRKIRNNHEKVVTLRVLWKKPMKNTLKFKINKLK